MKKQKIHKNIKKGVKKVTTSLIYLSMFLTILFFSFSFIALKRDNFLVQAQSEVLGESSAASTSTTSSSVSSESVPLISEKAKQVEAYILSQNGSPMFASEAQTAIDKANECGVDYKLMIAIAGYESGYGRKPMKKYNPYGWRNGKTYNSFKEAISEITCQFGNKYIKKGLDTVREISNIYLGSDGNHDAWIKNVTYIKSQIP
jgi:flagellum-specific peptidoglycan hydrolase FlgJ